jgi:hypothetical protein
MGDLGLRILYDSRINAQLDDLSIIVSIQDNTDALISKEAKLTPLLKNRL